MTKKMPPDFEKRFLVLYLSGKTYIEISDELGISNNVITDMRKKFGLQSRRELKLINRKRFAQMWNDGVPLIDICLILNMSSDQALNLAKKLGLEHRDMKIEGDLLYKKINS